MTPEHAAANAAIAGWMVEAGMRTWTDAAGNQCGRLEGATPGLPALMLGSHSDSVVDAGRYDGPLGIVVALEVADRVASGTLPVALEIVAFSDEEGARFGTALLGSHAVAGSWEPAWFDRVDADGVTLREAFTRFGLDPSSVGLAARDPAQLIGYLEAHIEQGPLLEAAGAPLGEVTSIAGARRFAVTLLGDARHAGGTPYDRRRDALVGASHVVLGIERLGRERGVLATVGRLRAFPGSVNVIPGRVELSLDLRAATDGERDAAWVEILAMVQQVCADGRLTFQVTEQHRAAAVACAPRLRAAVRGGIAATGQRDIPRLFSPAGHDGMAMAGVTGIGMLFIRCRDGISHSPEEDVLAGDVALAVEALEAAVLEFAQGAETDP